MSSEITIGEAQIDGLKHHLLHDFSEYGEFYARRNREPIKDRTKKFRPVWSEYVNGSKTKREDRRWHGVFRRWLEDFELPSPVVWMHEHYQIDCLLRTGDETLSGDYKILVALQQEYDPDEVIARTRAAYDFNIPEKVVLIWSSKKRDSIGEIAEEARRVPELARANGVSSSGRIHVVVANREIRDWWLGKQSTLPEQQFEYVLIESE